MSYYKNKRENNIKEQKFESLKKIILYNDPSTKNLDLTLIREYISSILPNLDVELRDEFFIYCIKLSDQEKEAVDTPNSKGENNSAETITELAKKIADTKIRNIYNPNIRIAPLMGEITLEERLLSDPAKALPGIFYDGIRLNEVFQELLAGNEIEPGICHICFTPRLFGTFDRFDKRYHARVILCSYPSLISTSGIIEAPAKPKAYYRIKQDLLRQNITTIDDFIPEELKQKYLKYDDSRLPEVLKGYTMQAIFYTLTSEPFCPDPGCRLFNAHWQEEVLAAQLSSPEFCDVHQEFLSSLR